MSDEKQSWEMTDEERMDEISRLDAKIKQIEMSIADLRKIRSDKDVRRESMRTPFKPGQLVLFNGEKAIFEGAQPSRFGADSMIRLFKKNGDPRKDTKRVYRCDTLERFKDGGDE